MKDLQQKVAYLQGLADGLDLDDSKEGRVISGILEVLEDMAEYVTSLEDQLEDMEDYIESIDSDLADVEDEIFELDDECKCGCEDDDENDVMVDVECPNCHEQVCFDSSILYDDDLIEVTCPNCDAVVFINDGKFSAEDEEDDKDDKDDDDETEENSEK